MSKEIHTLQAARTKLTKYGANEEMEHTLMELLSNYTRSIPETMKM